MRTLTKVALLLCVLPALGLAQTPAKPVRIDDKAPPTRTAGSLPAYPDDARQRRLGGVVTLDVTIDPRGKVTDVKPQRSVPALVAAATDAVRHWEYRIAPPMLNGVPVSALLTVVFYFDADTGRVEEVRRIPPQGPQPRKTKDVPPVFPKSLSGSGRAGRVMMEAVVDRAGHVIDIRVLNSTGAGFEAAARDAVHQWEYAPLVVSGAAVPFVLTVTVPFSQK